MAALDFNPQSVPPSDRSYSVLPAGWYTVLVTAASLEDTKNRDGKLIKLELEITSAQDRGRKLFTRVNFQNPSAEAQRIGQEQLRDICEAAGIARLTDTDQLLRKSLDVKVKISPARNGYDESNDVSAYVAAGTKVQGGGASAAPAFRQPAAAPAFQAPAQAQQAAAPAASGTPPWAKR